MDRAAANLVIQAFIQNIQTDLAAAAAVAKAAAICAETDNVPSAIKLIMDIEDPAHRADRTLQAILLIRHELLGDGPD